MEKRYLMTKVEFEQSVAEPRSFAGAGQDKKRKGVLDLARRIRDQWDGMDKTFLDSLTPGQHAVVAYSLMHDAEEFSSFGAYSPEVVPHAVKAIDRVRADEYGEVLRQAIEAFPGKKLPEFAEGWWKAMGNKKIGAVLEGVDKKINTGEGMARPLWDYVYEYAMAHRDEFYAK